MSTPLSELIPAPLKIERISNGFLLTWPSGDKLFAKDLDDALTLITADIRDAYRRAKEHTWDGKLEVWCGYQFSNGFSSKPKEGEE